MSSLRKRATLGMITGSALLAAGAAAGLWELQRMHEFFLEIAFSKSVLTYRTAAGLLGFALGGCLATAGLVVLLLSLVLWIQKPAPGSRLTLRGWQAPGTLDEKGISAEKAWRAAMFGIC